MAQIILMVPKGAKVTVTGENILIPSQLSPYLWYAEDVPTVSQMQQYLSNVAKLKAVVVNGVSTVVPADMENLTIAEANAIEQILVTVNDLLSRMLLTLVPAGTATSGGDYL